VAIHQPIHIQFDGVGAFIADRQEAVVVCGDVGESGGHDKHITLWINAPAICILIAMTSSTSNIEAVARDICSKHLSRHGACGTELAIDVDRYWHCVAAELEAGLIDDAGDRLAAVDQVVRLEAYRDWCSRHPASKPI
jgi:hypothetical protein